MGIANCSCGYQAFIRCEDLPDKPVYAVLCDDLNCSNSSQSHETEDKAIEEWNKKACFSTQ